MTRLADENAVERVGVLDAPTLLAALQQFYDQMPKTPRGPAKSQDELDNEARLEGYAEDRAFHNQYGGTDSEADHAADVDWDRRQRANDRAMERP